MRLNLGDAEGRWWNRISLTGCTEDTGMKQSQQGGRNRAWGVNLDQRTQGKVQSRQGCLRELSSGWEQVRAGVQGLRSEMGAACSWPWRVAE